MIKPRRMRRSPHARRPCAIARNSSVRSSRDLLRDEGEMVASSRSAQLSSRSAAFRGFRGLGIHMYRLAADVGRHCEGLCPYADKARGIGRIGAPRPTLSRVTTKRRQVSWLAGCRLGPPSQNLMAPVALWSSARRLQLRGQPRNCAPMTRSPHSHFDPVGNRQPQNRRPIARAVKRTL
mgnify:CR=1 FL=1